MSKTLFISFTAAACWLAAAAPQIANDAPGVTVSLNGATVMHRTGVNYPPAALQSGARGMVSVQVKLDSTGEVNDALVLSGPDELRKAALESVLQWHFTHDMAGTTRAIQIAFEPPKRADAPAVTNMPRMEIRPNPMAGAQPMQGRITSIRVSGLSEQLGAELLASLPVHQGDEWNAEAMQKTNEAAKAFDEHLTVRVASMLQGPSGAAEVGLMVAVSDAPPAMPGRIKVGGNVQGAMIITKVTPVYPAEAKQAGVSGQVLLAAVIGKDGTIQELNAVSGTQPLIQAAIDAVKQWVYKPTLLNGSPVEVETTITINFTLSQ